MPKLLISEKYKTALPFADLVGAKTKHAQKGCGWFEGNGWVVTWCQGHLVSMSMPLVYGDQYKRWSLDNLPLLPTSWKYEKSSSPGAAAQLAAIGKIFKEYDITEIYHAADSDREGEAIVREVIEWFRAEKIPAKRVWYRDTTKETLTRALKEAEPLSRYDDLALAADLRKKTDWLYGINLSRAYTSYKHSTQNVGRVVSPTINLVVELQKEIDAFVPQEYLTLTLTCEKNEAGTAKAVGDDFVAVEAVTGGAGGVDSPDSGNEFSVSRRFDNIEEGEKEKAAIRKGEQVIVTACERKQESTRRLLYDMTSLQAEAARHFGYSAKDTLAIAQGLYEEGLITYPRTSSNWITEEQRDETKAIIEPCLKGIFGSTGLAKVEACDIERIVIPKGKGAEASHSGLCPTEQGIRSYAGKIKGDAKRRNIFVLIAGRFVASLLPPNIEEKTTIKADCRGKEYTGNGRITIDGGFLPFEKFYLGGLAVKKKQSVDNLLPVLEVGDEAEVSSKKSEKKKTKPKKQYTEDTLLMAMKNISSVINKDLKGYVKDAGLGTQASRDTIIDTIKKSGFVDVVGRAFVPTEKAFSLMELLPQKIKDPNTTAALEQQLNEIAEGGGKEAGEKLITEVEAEVKEAIGEVKKLEPIPDKDRFKGEKVAFNEVCPCCGAPVVDTKKFWACKNNCGFLIWKTIAKKRLNKQIAKELLADGRTSEQVEGFTSKAGKPFSAFLKVDKTNKRVVMDFPNSRERH